MRYLTGEHVEVGDSVLIEKGKTEGIVFAIVDTPEKMNQWGADETGLLIESKPFGLVFWPHSEIEDPVIFCNRAQSTSN
ncbi:hypothetical protein [Methylomicrobium sp. Wu6]|uniref:hypothetical protein n=1 Tax=Methylomicrobium sp. Wu6 TaxID=3107928 RepID=UPI002DD631FC|nr:hypothetical protein [Methylomicrobium sp. Wu6]MEC4749044.1 hypothetical protein [Methylomicrobium sp. Wu6]